MSKNYPNVVSIAGVDPSGGAGIFADIKAFSALSAYGCGVVTALTAQNTKGVFGSMPVPIPMIRAQIDALFDDVEISAVKIGMLYDEEVISAVAASLRKWKPPFVVLDPVMIAKSGDPLLKDSSVEAMKSDLLPLSTVITPNLPEAARLLGVKDISGQDEIRKACEDLWKLKGEFGGVLIKGGHGTDESLSEDYLFDGEELHAYGSPRFHTKNTHGTGCTLSSAIAAIFPQVGNINETVRLAKEYITEAIRSADDLNVGKGHGPVKHFYKFW